MYRKITFLLLFSLLKFSGCAFYTLSSGENDNVQSLVSNQANNLRKFEGKPDENLVEELIWQGQVDRFQLKWTTKDIYIIQRGKSEKAIKLSDFAKRKAKEASKDTYLVIP